MWRLGYSLGVSLLPSNRSSASDVLRLNANVNNLAFWMLVRILATPGLVERLRDEIKSHCVIFRTEKISALPELPQIKIYVEGLTQSCPLLRACYLEALRLDSAPWSVKKIGRDFNLQADPPDMMGAGGHARSYHFQKGTIVGIPHVMHHKDPKYFEDPEQFIPERFIKQSDEPSAEPIVDGSGIRPYGGGSSMCKGRLFAEREAFAFVAGFLSLWEFEPIGASGWEIPQHQWATGVLVSSTPYRVRISRRNV
jgi:cytochrome P450